MSDARDRRLAEADVSRPPVDFDDVQGLLRFGYKHHTEARSRSCACATAAPRARWLAARAGRQRGDRGPLPPTALQVAFSATGLRALGVPTTSSSRLRGRVRRRARHRRRTARAASATSAPTIRRAGSGAAVRRGAARAGDASTPCRASSTPPAHDLKRNWAAGFELIALAADHATWAASSRSASPTASASPSSTGSASSPARGRDRLAYRNLALPRRVPARLPQRVRPLHRRPLLDPARRAAAQLPRAEDAPDRADLGRNGSYLVLRQLRQDVRRLLALPRRAGRRRRRASASASPRRWSAAAWTARRCVGPAATPIAGVGADAAARPQRLHVSTPTPRPALPGRRARPPRQPAQRRPAGRHATA